MNNVYNSINWSIIIICYINLKFMQSIYSIIPVLVYKVRLNLLFIKYIILNLTVNILFTYYFEHLSRFFLLILIKWPIQTIRK